MTLGIVVGTVVSSSKDEQIQGARYLLIDKCNQQGEKKGDYLVALDIVGVGPNEMVMISEGSTARETMVTKNKPIDALVVGIIDIIDENDIIVYKK
ncbi:MAG TPA: ethanolamine utilization protein EutN [Bacteroidales bacterium]|nr:MAG: ethanolamine utilization protein EutN [Bacteroidetes bacterium GWF2_33_38]OFY76637.1 MAG: ethanolamine utilization protein EutN [Bacteroidetes bacterium RIFOXYA12_FULL_33_9]OFY92395.1 MAG: ethanolamine utilization protein EutN [Bacteroidetes bacterium RIFOXYA2_FULL_33_7]HBF88557.1 ethanolamine utilization protein EutN [Bacteroidales bacterium]